MINNTHKHVNRMIDANRKEVPQTLRFAHQQLPNRIDLRSKLFPVEHQEDITSSANAFAGFLEYLIKHKYKCNINVSRLFIYYNSRSIETGIQSIVDDGATLENTTRALRRYDACEEQFWPYRKKLVNRKPPPHVYEKAKEYTVIPVKMSIDTKTIKTALANDLLPVIGMILLHSAGKEAAKNNGLISKPDPRATSVYNSERRSVVVVGYDEKERYFIVRNSWGQGWGLRGYFYLPYEYFLDPRLIQMRDGGWTIRDVLYRSSSSKLPIMRILCVTRNRSDKHSKHLKRSTSRPNLFPQLTKNNFFL